MIECEERRRRLHSGSALRQLFVIRRCSPCPKWYFSRIKGFSFHVRQCTPRNGWWCWRWASTSQSHTKGSCSEAFLLEASVAPRPPICVQWNHRMSKLQKVPLLKASHWLGSFPSSQAFHSSLPSHLVTGLHGKKWSGYRNSLPWPNAYSKGVLVS